MPLASVASPQFARRIDALVGAITLSVDDCGSLLRLPAWERHAESRSAITCEAPGGLCRACHGGDEPVGAPVGRQAARAWVQAVEALEVALGHGASGRVELPWPGALWDERARPLGRHGPLALLTSLLEAPISSAAGTAAAAGAAVLCPTDGEIITITPAIEQPRKPRRVIVRTTYLYEGQAHSLEVEHSVPPGPALVVRLGEVVLAAAPLTEGEPSPHDVLAILGEIELARWMLACIERLFAAGGAALDPRHAALALRQMLRRVTIVEPHDGPWEQGAQVERSGFYRENERLLAEGREPAVARATLLGLSEAGE